MEEVEECSLDYKKMSHNPELSESGINSHLQVVVWYMMMQSMQSFPLTLYVLRQLHSHSQSQSDSAPKQPHNISPPQRYHGTDQPIESTYHSISTHPQESVQIKVTGPCLPPRIFGQIKNLRKRLQNAQRQFQNRWQLWPRPRDGETLFVDGEVD